MSDDLRDRIARALAGHQQAGRGLDQDHYRAEEWLCCASAVVSVLDERRHAYEELLAALWLYIGRYEVKQLTTGQKNLLADAVDAMRARRAGVDPAYDGPGMVDRWWAE